jgi:hypothetical protein
MGLFGYQLLKQLNPEEQQARRAALDLNATIAQASIGVVLALIQVYFVISWVSSKVGKSREDWTPSSPYVKHEYQREKKSVGGGLRSFGRRVKWYMDEPVVEGWGSTGAWFAGSIWMAWLLALCVRNTGDGKFDFFFGPSNGLLFYFLIGQLHVIKSFFVFSSRRIWQLKYVC